jgi:hypothetical protein
MQAQGNCNWGKAPADKILRVQERPCTRCIKRNIGHLCHDEPREPAKKSKSEQAAGTENEPPSHLDPAGGDSSLDLSRQQDTAAALGLGPLSQSNRGNTASLVQPTPIVAPQPSSLTSTTQPCMLHRSFERSKFSSGLGLSCILTFLDSTGWIPGQQQLDLWLRFRFGLRQLPARHAQLSSSVLVWDIRGVE